jgi:hypothetical protein
MKQKQRPEEELAETVVKTDQHGYVVSEPSVYRLLRRRT